MKNVYIIMLLLGSSLCLAQSPNRINFQAVIRDTDGNLVESENLVLEIGFKASLSSPGFAYRESHNVQTNAYGQVAVLIGNGTILTGTFNAIDWSTGTVTFEAVATINGNNLVVSQQQLSSVPYALFATKALSLSGADDIDNTNEIQSLNLNGNILGISGHPGTVNLAPLLDNTDNQTLSLDNTNLTITGGNSVDLAPFIANVDTSPSNEIQHLSVTGSTLQLSQSANTINLGPYLGANTDEQTLSLVDNSLSITNGNAVDLSPYLQNALQVSFNNATSGLSATTVQAALDEVVAEKPDNLQEAYAGGATVQLNGVDEFRIRNNTAAPILSTSNAIRGIGVGVETPQHKVHMEGTTLLTTHSSFDAIEALTGPGTFETGELHYFTEGDNVNHINIAVTNIMNGTGTNFGNMNMAQSNTATQNYGVYGFATGASILNIGMRARAQGTNVNSQNQGVQSTVAGVGNFNVGINSTSTGASIENIGIRGFASGTATTSYGVLGQNNSTGATNYGSYGSATGAGTTNYGVYGTASGGTTNYAGYFQGNVVIAGGSLESSGATLSINDALSITGALMRGSSQIIDIRNESVYAGPSAGLANVGATFRNVGIGNGTLQAHTNGPDNVAIGAYALNAQTTGLNNVAIGSFALNDNTTSSGNVAMGSYAADGITTLSDHNVAIGISSLSSITTSASYNTAVGAASMQNVTAGSENVAIGSSTMNSINSAGNFNVAVGAAALVNINNGNSNVVIGRSAGGNIDTENNNVLLGAESNTVGNVQNGVAIGYQATVAQNDAIILGNVANGNIRVGIGINAPTEKLHVLGNALITGTITTTAVTQTSDKRLKENIQSLDLNEVLQIINAIDGYQYTWKADSASTDKRIQYGVIAQEVERVLPDIVHTDAKGYKSVNYTALIPFLLETVKSQQQKIEALQKSNDSLQSLLEKELSALAAEVKVLRNEKTINTEKP